MYVYIYNSTWTCQNINVHICPSPTRSIAWPLQIFRHAVLTAKHTSRPTAIHTSTNTGTHTAAHTAVYTAAHTVEYTPTHNATYIAAHTAARTATHCDTTTIHTAAHTATHVNTHGNTHDNAHCNTQLFRHVTCCTYECATAHIWMSHVWLSGRCWCRHTHTHPTLIITRVLSLSRFSSFFLALFLSHTRTQILEKACKEAGMSQHQIATFKRVMTQEQQAALKLQIGA